jgi:hypothetical protein
MPWERGHAGATTIPSTHSPASAPHEADSWHRAQFRVRKSECDIVVSALSEPSSSRFPGDIFGQKGRETVGHGNHNKEG